MAVYKFAGFWRRLVAYTVDNIIINIVFFVLSLIILTGFIIGTMSGRNLAWIEELADPARLTFLVLPATILYIAISIVYFTYFHGIKGRTPGKMLMGLQVLSVEGTPISFGVSFLRSVGYLVSSIFYIGFIWAAFDRRKQGWHDKIAGTVVIIIPRENEAAGLVIPEPQVPSIVRQPDEKQSDTGSQEMVSSIQPPVSENSATAGQAGINEQKIP